MNILFVNACLRETSRTHRLAKKVLQKLAGQVMEINLEKEPVLPLTQKVLEKRSQLLAAKKYDDVLFNYAHQFAQADVIVIAAPYWDLSFPAVLKCFVEAVSIVGITFEYTDRGVQGLCRAKKLIYVTTAGGYIPENDFGFGYFKALASQLYGIPETLLFKAEGLDIIGADVEAQMQQSLTEIETHL